MNSKRLFIVLVLSICLLSIASIASAYYGYQMLSDKTLELNDLKVKTSALEAQERSLIKAKEEIQQYALLEEVAKSIVPQEKDQARTVRELVAIADESGVNISGISFPTSNLGNAKPGATETVTQLKKVDGIPELQQLEIAVTIDNQIDYPTLLNFLDRLEKNRRTSAISSIIITPTLDEPTNQYLLQVSITLQVYIKP